MFLDPCRCASCTPENVEHDQCKHTDVDAQVRQMMRTWRVYVDEGGVNLMDMPYWVREVAEVVGNYRAERALERTRDRYEQRKQREMMDRIGIPT